MALPALVGLGLSLLPKIPDMWNAVSGLFGKKVPETVVEAGKLADDVLGSLKKGEVPIEIQVKLEELALAHKERITELTLKEKELEYESEKLVFDSMAGVRELEKAAYASGDEYVARTRPKILRDLFATVAIYTVASSIGITVMACVGVEATAIAAVVSFLKWVGGFLYGTFSASFIGYTTARSIDKRNPNLKDGNSITSSLVNTALKLGSLRG